MSFDHPIQYATDGDADRNARASSQSLAELVGAMSQSLALAETAREDARLAEKHSRIISWSSVGIAVASLAVAVVAIFLQ